ncbi:hypothetical protein BC937DRAFT_87523 [Endogone sp. FLAS-F59071]|nr:hypothetical protein BC937DRAFT_87523 [Endogone sp. FLAS-F59071]|eukprot:RUS19411.1 hypothetical protein BC937DRAFT_87523 [Endogone sp. FLAS-F59071]
MALRLADLDHIYLNVTHQCNITFAYNHPARYVQNLTPAEYEQNLKIISTVDTVQAFWSVYNNIAGPDRLPFRASLHFMKKGIKPIWEDPKNEDGGAYNFRIIKKDSPVGWREILMLLIGEQFEDCLSADDSVCGVSVSTRYMSDNFQIWTANAAGKNEEKVKVRLTQVLSPIEVQSMYYKAEINDLQFPTKSSQVFSHTCDMSSNIQIKTVHKSHVAFKKSDQEDSKGTGEDKEQSRERPRFFKRPEEVPGDHEQTPEQRAQNEALEKELADRIAAVQLKDRQDRQGMEEGEAQA